MCGIAGYIVCSSADKGRTLEQEIKKMVQSLEHRGPNDSGTWVGSNSNIALGHARLSVIDLSSAGHQPMTSANKRFVITYNGEVYNYRSLRNELEKTGSVFHSDSDTEVILEACSVWGIEKAVKRFNGMFAFAIWDCVNDCLTLVRDRMGIKPVYWGWVGGDFVFASELKAMSVLPEWQEKLDSQSFYSYLNLGYIPAPSSIYQNIFKLEPGCMLTVQIDGQYEILPYWNLQDVWKNGSQDIIDVTAISVINDLEELMCDAVKQRMISDVPLGAFLSGGIDSSLIVAMMQAGSEQSINSFTMGFEQASHDEAGHARKIANYLGTNHTELTVTSSTAQSVIPDLAEIYDEPFADSSQIPSFLVSKLTRKHVTVALSGDGADELFAGYNRYIAANSLWPNIEKIPFPLRRILSSTISTLSGESWNNMLSWIPGCPSHIGLQLERISRMLTAESSTEMYKGIISQWSDPDSILVNNSSYSNNPVQLNLEMTGLVEQMQLTDAMHYLPDDILTKVDRASMAVSLEVRVPMLDYRVVEYASRLSREHKINKGKGKWILRQILTNYLPDELSNRPKIGFSIPLSNWLRGPLREWAENLLSYDRLQRESIFLPKPIRTAWERHLSGKQDLSGPLWCVLMFQAWSENRMKQGHSISF